MQIQDIVRPIDQLSDEELFERIREVRQRRQVDRPAAKARVERAERKTVRREGTAAVNKITNVLDSMSDADRLKLIKLLGG